MANAINLQNNNDEGFPSHLSGLNKLPDSIIQSNILTSKNLKQLAAVDEIPFIDPSFQDDQLKNIIQYYSIDPDEMENEIHVYAKQLLDKEKVKEAWQVLLTTVP